LAERISRVVNVFVRGLSRDDQVLFQLRFESDMPVPQIATALHQDAQALYRRLRAHMSGLRVALEVEGISAHDIARMTGSDAAILDFQLKSGGGRSSNDGGTTSEEDV